MNLRPVNVFYIFLLFEDYITVKRFTRQPVQVPPSHLLIVEHDIWDPNVFRVDMDFLNTTMLVFVPYEKGVIPILQVYKWPRKGCLLLYHTIKSF